MYIHMYTDPETPTRDHLQNEAVEAASALLALTTML